MIYYTDLQRVWRISPQASEVSPWPMCTARVVLDDRGNLYGEDLEGLGGDRWRYRVWRLSPDGRLERMPWRRRFRDDYGFVPDFPGALYWASCVVGTRLAW